MNFLKKLFGQKPAEYAPREPRVVLNENHRVSFQLIKPATERPVRPANISTRGLALYREGMPQLKTGEEIQGQLKVNTDVFDIGASVRYVAPKMMGLLILTSNPDIKRSVENYLRLEILGLKLNRVDEQYLKADPNGKVIWFTDGRQNEVYCVHDDRGIVNFHLTFLGNYVQGGRGKSTMCGYVKEDSRKEPGHKSSDLIEAVDVPAPEMLQIAASLVQNVEKMPPELKAELLSHLSS